MKPPLHASRWLLFLPILVLGDVGSHAKAKTYEETISALRPFVDIPRSGVRETRGQMDEQVAQVVRQWDGYSNWDALNLLLQDLSNEKYRLQAQKWMFRIHTGDPGSKGDLLARLVQTAANEDQRHRLLLLADPRYAHPSSLLRSVLVNYLDDRSDVWDEESKLRWSMRGRLQCVIFEYLSKHQLIPDGDDLPQLAAYMDPEYEEEVIARTKRLIDAHPEHFASPDTHSTNDRNADESSGKATHSKSIAQPPSPNKAAESKATPAPSEDPTSSTPSFVWGVLIVAAIGLLWLLLKGRK